MPQPLHQHPTLRAPGERRGAPILSTLALATAAAAAITQGTAHGFGYDPILGAPLLRLSGGPATAFRTLWPLWLALPVGLYLIPATRSLEGVAVLVSTVFLSLGHGPLYAPWDYLDWLVAVRHEPTLRAVAIRPLGWASGALLAVLVLAAARRRLPSAGHVHGSGRFATAEETRRFGLLSREGIVLGQLAPTWWGRRRLLRHAGTEHVLFIGHTRAGKTSGCAIPSVLGWRDHLVVFDPKGGEIFQATAGAKHADGHRVLRFAPGSEGGARWNPLWEIEPGPGEVAQMQRLALNLISSPTGPGGDPHWVQLARQVFVALALHVLYGERFKSIGRCRELLMGTAGEDPRAPFRTMVDAVHDGDGERGWRDPGSGIPSPTHPEVRRITSALLKTPLRELGSILSTLNKYLEPWADPRVDASTEVSDFSLQALRGEAPTAIYVTTARSDVERLAPLLRVFFTSAAATLSGEEAYVDWAARRRGRAAPCRTDARPRWRRHAGRCSPRARVIRAGVSRDWSF